jgi:hypothetical protein
MPHCVDAAVDPEQATGRNAPGDRLGVQVELPCRHDAELTGGQHDHLRIRLS